MDTLLQVLQNAASIAFALLGVVSVIDYLRAPSRRRAFIAIALGSLAVTNLIGRANTLLGVRSAALTAASILLFQMSAFGLLLLRDSYIKIGRRGWVLAVGGLFGSALTYIVVGSPPAPAEPSAVQAGALYSVVVTWIIAVGEPAVRFWRASRHLPIVQRRRLQAMSIGYLATILILLSVFLPRRTSADQGFQVAINLMAVGIAPLLYAGFSPPQWLRRIWREGEEEPFREAVHDLLLFSPSRRGLADRAADWAVRLVGADFGMLMDGDGTLMAVRGASPEEAVRRASALLGEGNHRVGPDGGLSGSAIVLPMPLDSGVGYMVIEAGPFTPVFGQDEVLRLRQYASSVTVALDRARVSERVLALEEVKSRFLKLASHELRGPLALVKGYVSMVADGSIGPEELPKVMPMIQGRLEQMSAMLNEMLETARLEDDRLELKPERFDVRQAVETVTEALKPLAGSEHPFVIRVPAQEVAVMADRARVETIVTNLIDNAIKYSPLGGDINCSVEVRDGEAFVNVTDRGIGISSEDMTTLFTRFGRITSDATVSIPGTGLGLYLSRELARMQRGDLTARSRAGEGSTFTLRLPLAGAT